LCNSQTSGQRITNKTNKINIEKVILFKTPGVLAR
jgi:hypothetical protein